MNKRRILGFYIKDQNKKKYFCGKFKSNLIVKGYSFTETFSNPNFSSFYVYRNNEEDRVNLKNNKIQIDGFIENKNSLDEKLYIQNLKDDDFIESLNEKYIDIERRLLGNYVFSVFNEDKSSIVLVRDHFGTRPLFYTDNSDYFAYSSEIKFLECLSDFQATPNISRIKFYLCQNRKNSHETFYNEIFSLLPSHKLTFLNNEIKIGRYNHYKKYSFKGSSIEDAKKELYGALKASCESKLEQTKSFGVQLSGGIDSATVFSILNDLNPGKVKTFSMNFYDEDKQKMACDEDYFQELIHKNSSNHSKLNFFKESPYSNVDNWLNAYDQPFNLANVYLFEKLHGHISQNNFDALFDGSEGDVVISHGWERFKELFKFHSIINFFYELTMFAKKHNYDQYSKSSLFTLFLRPLVRDSKALSPLLNLKRQLSSFFLNSNKNKKTSTKLRILKDSIMEEMKMKEAYDFNRNFLSHHEKLSNPLIEQAFINQNILLYEYGITQLSPFFDKRVTDLCLSFPSSLKLRHGSSRYILRETFKDFLPRKIINRFSKSNLSENFIKKISNDDFKKIEDEINDIHSYIFDLIDRKALKKCLSLLKARKQSELVSMTIWNFYQVNRWLKIKYPE